ncbi:Uncharacterised protein [uncultured archaeon]|nr:Uncharacterised protein [uncultured archaeon]
MVACNFGFRTGKAPPLGNDLYSGFVFVFMGLGEVLLDFDEFAASYEKPYLFDFNRVRHWFPLSASEDFAGLIGDLMGDGHLQAKPKWRLDFTSNSAEELQRFGYVVKNLFGVDGKIRACTTNCYGTMNYGVNCKPLARLMVLCGVPSGSKPDKVYQIPKWILGNKAYFRKFVSRYFTCEGSVDMHGAISLAIFKEESLVENGIGFLSDIRLGLDRFFDVQTEKPFLWSRLSYRKEKPPSRGIVLKIRRRRSLLAFYKNVGFESLEKNLKLNALLERQGNVL